MFSKNKYEIKATMLMHLAFHSTQITSSMAPGRSTEI